MSTPDDISEMIGKDDDLPTVAILDEALLDTVLFGKTLNVEMHKLLEWLYWHADVSVILFSRKDNVKSIKVLFDKVEAGIPFLYEYNTDEDIKEFCLIRRVDLVVSKRKLDCRQWVEPKLLLCVEAVKSIIGS